MGFALKDMVEHMGGVAWGVVIIARCSCPSIPSA